MSYIIDAIYNNDLESVKSLLKSEYDPNIVIPFKNFDSTALICASHFGYIDIVKELLKYGADHNKRNKYDITPLITAAFCGHFDVVKELLKLDNNKIDKDYMDVIAHSYRNGRLEIARALKEHLINELKFLWPLITFDITRHVIMHY